MSRLPAPGGDNNDWGSILNDYLSQSLNSDGTLKPVSSSSLDSSTQTAIGKANSAVQTVNGKSGSAVTLTASDVGAPTTLAADTDVNVAGVSDSQVLSYSTGASKWIPATVSSTPVGDATSSSKGIIQLAGDLGGTAAAPTVTATANFKTQVETVRLDQMAAPTASVSLNSQKITNLTNGSSAQDAAAFGQIPTSLPPGGSASGDLTGSYPSPTLSNTANVESIISANTTVAGAEQAANKTTDGSLAANSDTLYPSEQAVKTYSDTKLSKATAVASGMGVIVHGADATVARGTDFAHYVWVGSVQPNNMIDGDEWDNTNGDGAVIGPASAVNNDFVIFDGTTGKLVKDNGVALDTDSTMAANSDVKITSQKATKTALDLKVADVTQNLPGLIVPSGFPMATSTTVPSAGPAFYIRFVCPKSGFTAHGINVVTTVAATNDDAVAVALLASDGVTLLANSGSVSGKMNATAGRQQFDFTTPYLMTAGTVYFAAFQYGTVGGTAATLLTATFVDSKACLLVSGAAPSQLMAKVTPTFPFATSPSLDTHIVSGSPLMFVRSS